MVPQEIHRRYLFVDDSVQAMCLKLAAAKFNADCPSGKALTTRVRRRISRSMRSNGLLVRIPASVRPAASAPWMSRAEATCSLKEEAHI
jgi:hypothetical protein